ncbi:TPA: hypothetical protein NKO30_007345, partial [Pseudomonas aeruginosa]|nr:hypothetical protein [Pseudomonas aeruginosa]
DWVLSNGGHTLTGSIGGQKAIVLELTGASTAAAGGNAVTAGVKVTLFDGFPHEDTPNASELVLSNIKVIATDTDGDTATGMVSVKVIDDAPTVDVGTVNLTGLSLTTQDADTVAGPDTDSASFKTAFEAAVSAHYGADGAGSTTVSGYALSMTGADGMASGLSSHGEAITLSKVGNDIVGSTSHGEVFRISVDATTGTVTLKQSQTIDHLPESPNTTNDNAYLSLPVGKITLSATATVTDSDNDQVTKPVSADLGGHIGFDDAVPTVDVG